LIYDLKKVEKVDCQSLSFGKSWSTSR